MIYDAINNQDPIRQGDIFHNIPRVDLSLSQLPVVGDIDTVTTTWEAAIADVEKSQPITALLPVKAVNGIVITQNCDAARGEYLCLCQINDFLSATDTPPKNPRKWQSLITRHTKANLRIFYLPADDSCGYPEPMGVDFRTIIRIKRIDLEAMRTTRKVRLNHMATEHFRESLAQFFRRYPYDEWYPLTKDQFEAYREAKKPESPKPYPWQE